MKQIILGLMATALLVPAFGQGEVKQREGNQTDRIDQGVKNGTLTKTEAARLKQQQRDIHHEVREDKAANGGKLTSQEKAQVTKDQNRASKQIYKQKHDAQNHK